MSWNGLDPWVQFVQSCRAVQCIANGQFGTEVRVGGKTVEWAQTLVWTIGTQSTDEQQAFLLRCGEAEKRSRNTMTKYNDTKIWLFTRINIFQHIPSLITCKTYHILANHRPRPTLWVLTVNVPVRTFGLVGYSYAFHSIILQFHIKASQLDCWVWL